MAGASCAPAPERLHHPKESDLLYPCVVRAVPSLMAVVRKLESDHMNGEKAARELQHLRLEETAIRPEADKVLSAAEWQELDAAFARNCDPLTGKYPPGPAYDRLFTRIVMRAPAPIGLGEG